MVFDSRRNRFLMFGGHLDLPLGDLWQFKSGQWTPLSASGPTPRYAAMGYYDPHRDKFVLYGGLDSSAVRNDTWEFDCATDTWSQVSIVGTLPPATFRTTMVYDLSKRIGILALAYPYLGTADSTWSFDGISQQWSKIPVGSTGPRSSDYSSIVYHPLRQTVVKFGGFYGGDLLAEMWELRNDKWERLQPANAPFARGASVAQYDPSTKAIILFGGTGTELRNDTWLWRWNSVEGSDQACPAVGTPGNVDTDGDGLDSDHDPDCWWRRTPNCPPGTSCL
jgi:hypothetical protein